MSTLSSENPIPMGGGYPNLIREILYAPPAPPTCLALIEVALSYHNSSQYEAAIDAYQQARNDWIEMEGDIPVEGKMFFHLAIGSVYESEGSDDLALAEYLEAMRFEYDLESDHPDRALVYSMIGSIQFHRREYSDALDYFERARTLREEVLPEDHVDIALIDTNIGACFFCLQRESEAMINFKRAALVFRSALGPYHPRTLSVARNIEKAKNNSLKNACPVYVAPAPMLGGLISKSSGKTKKKGKKSAKGKKKKK